MQRLLSPAAFVTGCYHDCVNHVPVLTALCHQDHLLQLASDLISFNETQPCRLFQVTSRVILRRCGSKTLLLLAVAILLTM